jgi:hypothetical protein
MKFLLVSLLISGFLVPLLSSHVHVTVQVNGTCSPDDFSDECLCVDDCLDQTDGSLMLDMSEQPIYWEI